MSSRPRDQPLNANRRLLVQLGVVVVAMFGFGFALVPFYEKICEVTGLRNIAQAGRRRRTRRSIATRTVRIEFDANVRNLPWRSGRCEPIVDVHPGELTQVIYEVVNTTDAPVTGQAIPELRAAATRRSTSSKLECFCFTKQTLAAGRDAADAGGVRRRSGAAGGRRRRSRCRTRSSKSKAAGADDRTGRRARLA